MLNANMLRAEIVMNDLKLSEFSEKVKIKKCALYRKLAGKTEFSRGEIERIYKALNLSADQVMAIFFNQKVS